MKYDLKGELFRSHSFLPASWMAPFFTGSRMKGSRQAVRVSQAICKKSAGFDWAGNRCQ